MTALTLRAVFVADDSEKRRGFTGARCELPNGQVVETKGQRSPLYALARQLEALGFGDWKLQAYTPTGTPSLRGKVSVMAGMAVTERDKAGLRLEKYKPFEGPAKLRGGPQDAHLGSEGTQPPENEKARLSESPSDEEAA